MPTLSKALRRATASSDLSYNDSYIAIGLLATSRDAASRSAPSLTDPRKAILVFRTPERKRLGVLFFPPTATTLGNDSFAYLVFPDSMNHEVKSQLSVSIENTPGAIAKLTDLLADHDVSLNALSVSERDTAGVFRFTASEAKAAESALRAAGYDVKVEEVLSIRLQDSKGRLAFLAKALSESGINIDYMYASVDHEGAESRLILKVSNIHLASRLLEQILVAA